MFFRRTSRWRMRCGTRSGAGWSSRKFPFRTSLAEPLEIQKLHRDYPAGESETLSAKSVITIVPAKACGTFGASTSFGLVAEAEAWARARGAVEMGSDARTDNAASRAAHAALGYSECRELVHFIKRIDATS